MALNDVEHCEACQIHEDVVKAVTDHMPDEDQLYDLAEVFKVFGDSTRIKILYVLFEAELCVCDIAQLLNMTQSAISHQLRILKQNRLVKNRRDGKSVFYSLADSHVKTIIREWSISRSSEKAVLLQRIFYIRRNKTMKKKFKLMDLDCANCAAKMEDAIKKIDGVNDATVSFMMQKLTLDADDDRFDEILKEAAEICKKVEPDCKIVM